MSFKYTETYRSGHNGADSKSVREQSPASSNLAVSAIKNRCTFVCLFLFFARFEKGNAKHKNSPGDCFGARVRAVERRSEPGESRRLRHKKQVHFCVPVFIFARFEKGNAKHKNSPGLMGKTAMATIITMTNKIKKIFPKSYLLLLFYAKIYLLNII